jgi:hypothetical protein
MFVTVNKNMFMIKFYTTFETFGFCEHVMNFSESNLFSENL